MALPVNMREESTTSCLVVSIWACSSISVHRIRLAERPLLWGFSITY